MSADGAILSPCGKYRYLLWRTILFEDIQPGRVVDLGKTMLFVMLNPSTADATQDDPTIRRCRHFAQREGCGRLLVANRRAYRATDPKELAHAFDPYGGIRNAQEIQDALDRVRASGGITVVAWGTYPLEAGELEFWTSIARTTTLHCLGTTQDGAPKHPLARGKSAVRNDTPLVRWLPPGVSPL